MICMKQTDTSLLVSLKTYNICSMGDRLTRKAETKKKSKKGDNKEDYKRAPYACEFIADYFVSLFAKQVLAND